MLLREATGHQTKSVGYLLSNCGSVFPTEAHPSPHQIIQVPDTVLGFPPELSGEVTLLKTPRALASEYGEIKLVLTRKFPFY